MQLADYLLIIRRNWILLVVFLLVGVVVAAGYTSTRTPQYQTTATAYVSVSSGGSVNDLTQATTYTQSAVKNYVTLAGTAYVLNGVIKQLKLPETSAELAGSITANAPLDTAILQITATDSSPSRAAAIANAVVAQLDTAVVALTPDGNGSVASVSVTMVDPAQAPSSPITPRVPLNLALGALLGLAIAITVAVLRETLDTRVRGVRDIRNVIARPVLGEVVYDGETRARPLVGYDASYSPRSESFRSTRTNLQFLDFGTGSRSMVVSSAIDSEGKSTTAANLAISIAATGQSVVIVDADLRRPRLAEYFGLEGAIGASEVLDEEASLDDALQSWGTNGLVVMTSGRIPPNPTELLQSDAMIDMIAELRRRFDTVIFDAPPLLAVSDAAIVAKRTDGAVVVAAAGRVQRAQFAGAVDVLQGIEARILGVIVTMVPRRGPDAVARPFGRGYRPTAKRSARVEPATS